MRFSNWIMVAVTVFACWLIQPHANADEYAGAVFKGAEPLEIPQPRYPKTEALRGAEGWVLLSYVVNEDGAVIDPIVEDSTGSRAFEKAALRALIKSRYSPATRGGKPVQQCHTKRKTTFVLDSAAKGARREFVSKYRKVQKALAKKDLETAGQLIDELAHDRRHNLYEESYLWILKSNYYEQTADNRAQMQSLRRAVSYEQGYLPHGLFNNVTANLFRLEVTLGEYAEAMATYEMLKNAPEAEPHLKVLQNTMQQIVDLAESDQTFLTNGEIVDERWSLGLLKKAFAFVDVKGQIDSVDIRCDKKRREYDFEADKQWNIPRSWGKCHVYVAGKNGTTFGLAQSSAQI